MLGWRTLIAILFFPMGFRSFLMEKMVKGSSVDRRLLAYAIASTTVVGSGSLAQAGIYGQTNLNVSVSSNSNAALFYDLDKDGAEDIAFFYGGGPNQANTVDFAIAVRPLGTEGGTNYAAVVVDGTTTVDFGDDVQNKDAAAKLSGGFTVGETLSAYNWGGNNLIGFGAKIQNWDATNGSPSEGNFAGVTEKYIGFRVHLSSNEELVYGWAKVSTVTNLNEIGVSGDVILHGYAYESTPNTAIVAGASPVPEPTSLAIFAMGGAGIAAWKRRRKAVAQA
jgi:PEP-CTERM motif